MKRRISKRKSVSISLKGAGSESDLTELEEDQKEEEEGDEEEEVEEEVEGDLGVSQEVGKEAWRSRGVKRPASKVLKARKAKKAFLEFLSEGEEQELSTEEEETEEEEPSQYIPPRRLSLSRAPRKSRATPKPRTSTSSNATTSAKKFAKLRKSDLIALLEQKDQELARVAGGSTEHAEGGIDEDQEEEEEEQLQPGGMEEGDFNFGEAEDSGFFNAPSPDSGVDSPLHTEIMENDDDVAGGAFNAAYPSLSFADRTGSNTQSKTLVQEPLQPPSPALSIGSTPAQGAIDLPTPETSSPTHQHSHLLPDPSSSAGKSSRALGLEPTLIMDQEAQREIDNLILKVGELEVLLGEKEVETLETKKRYEERVQRSRELMRDNEGLLGSVSNSLRRAKFEFTNAVVLGRMSRWNARRRCSRRASSRARRSPAFSTTNSASRSLNLLLRDMGSSSPSCKAGCSSAKRWTRSTSPWKRFV